MGDVMNQLRQLRPPPVNELLTERVLLRAKGILAGRDHLRRPSRERMIAVLVAAMSLAHAIWTVVFMNRLAR